MKVYVYGNTLNSAFNMTKLLRKNGVDAEMFLDNSSPNDQDYPWWDDKSLSKDNLPSWVHYYDVFPNFVLPTGKTKEMIDSFAKCDIALVSCYGPILSMKAKVPFVFYSLGSDLNMIDFREDVKAFIFNSYSLIFKVRKLVKMFTFGRMQARAIKKFASKVIIYTANQDPYIIRNGLGHKTMYLNTPMDILNYGVGVDPELKEEFGKYDTVFFMFARHSWRTVWNDSKGNDKFIRAFARYVKEKDRNVLFLMTKKGMDADASRKLVEELGIEDKYIRWIDDMPKYQFRKYQALPNVVMVDNFWHDKWFERYPEFPDKPKICLGFGCVETLASKGLLLTGYNDDVYAGEDPPILSAFTEDEIYQRIEQVDAMSDAERDEMRQAGFDFAVRWHEQTQVVYKHINVIEDTYRELGQ